MKKILILGASGMLGHKVFEVLSCYEKYNVYGTVTKFESFANCLPEKYREKIITGVYADNIANVEKVLLNNKPDVVINCIGVIKQNEKNKDTKNTIVLNALFPHQVAEICEKIGAKFITIATDCVFDGKKGNYTEEELPTCHDVYGMSKYLGEVKTGNALTIRTSIVGHELSSSLSLIDWFLSLDSDVTKGYTKAIFSGLTTVEISKVLAEKLIESDLTGLYHLSVNPIKKIDLLSVFAKAYSKKIGLIPDESVEIDRSLDSSKLRSIIDYQVPSWEKLAEEMHNDFLKSEFYKNKREKYERENKF